MPRTLSESGKALIKGFEGLSLKAYKDANGYSIGYGHFGASSGQTITRAEADALFDQDIRRFESSVNVYAPVTTQNQFDALVSLAYNIGTGAFQTSTLLRYHVGGDYQAAADQFLVWRKSGGVVLPALEKRRALERSVYLGHGYPDGGPSGTGSFSPGGSWSSVQSETRLVGPSSVIPMLLALTGLGYLFLRKYG